METMPIGTRIRYWRRRRGGMTQSVLAGLAGLSQSYISQVESGRLSIDKRSTLAAIAAALQVTVADLLGEPGDPTDPAKQGAAAAVPAIWAALIEIEEGERRTPARTPDELAAAVERAARLRVRMDFPGLARVLPELLPEAAAHGGVVLTRAADETAFYLKNLGYRHLALTAARVSLAAARQAEDAAWIGVGRFQHTLCLPIETAGVASRGADRAITELQARAAAPEARQVLGLLHLAAAFSCAVDGRAGDARAHLAEARREAASLGDPADGYGFNLYCFGPTNVGIWRMGIEAELGEYGRVPELAREIHPGRLQAPTRHQAYWMSLGRALAHSGRADQPAQVAFLQAERAAPHAFALNPLAHSAVSAMVRRTRQRSVSKDLRLLAGRLGIEA